MTTTLDAGIPGERISFSSDGQGSLPNFDPQGNFLGLSIGSCSSLWSEVRDAVLEEHIPLETALKVIASSPADHYRLPGRKGHLEPGGDADMVFLDNSSLNIRTVMARGKVVVHEGEPVVFGTFERKS